MTTETITTSLANQKKYFSKNSGKKKLNIANIIKAKERNFCKTIRIIYNPDWFFREKESVCNKLGGS
jgi:hypothetical protein